MGSPLSLQVSTFDYSNTDVEEVSVQIEQVVTGGVGFIGHCLAQKYKQTTDPHRQGENVADEITSKRTQERN